MNHYHLLKDIRAKFGIHIRAIYAKFGIHNSPQSPDIGQNSDGGISDFQISGQSLIKENCHNYRTSDNIDMKLGPVTVWSSLGAGFRTQSLQKLCFQ